MDITIGQAVTLIRATLLEQGSSLARNHALRKLSHFEMQLGGYAGVRMSLPRVEPSKDFGKRSEEPSEPKEEESVVEAVPEEKKTPSRRRSYKKSSDEDEELEQEKE